MPGYRQRTYVQLPNGEKVAGGKAWRGLRRGAFMCVTISLMGPAGIALTVSTLMYCFDRECKMGSKYKATIFEDDPLGESNGDSILLLIVWTKRKMDYSICIEFELVV
jgi:hypothetical protein